MLPNSGGVEIPPARGLLYIRIAGMGLRAKKGVTMKSRFLISAGMIAAFAAFAAAQEAAPAAPDPDTSATTHQEMTQQSTETTAAPGIASSTTTETTTTRGVSGTVRTYEAGKSVTIVRADGSTVTYMIDPTSQLPSDVAVGKKVTVTTTVGSSSQPVVQRMTYTTKTTTTKTVEPPR
jgi:hypothetical protein